MLRTKTLSSKQYFGLKLIYRIAISENECNRAVLSIGG